MDGWKEEFSSSYLWWGHPAWVAPSSTREQTQWCQCGLDPGRSLQWAGFPNKRKLPCSHGWMNEWKPEKLMRNCKYNFTNRWTSVCRQKLLWGGLEQWVLKGSLCIVQCEPTIKTILYSNILIQIVSLIRLVVWLSNKMYFERTKKQELEKNPVCWTKMLFYTVYDHNYKVLTLKS